MFANLTYDDKVAFFGLLDEYFESRPHLFNGGGGSTSHAASPVASTSSGGRTLTPMAPSSGGRPLPPIQSPTSPPPRTNSAGGFGFGGGGQSQGQNGEKPDMATRMIMGGLKLGTSGARTGLGMLSKNPAAMDALGKMGAAAMVNSAQGSLNKGQGQAQGQGQSPTSPTASMGADPVAPPPSRTAPAPKRTAVSAPAAMGQARAMYDYEGADEGDLGVQDGQVVYVAEKTSADWWTCEDANGRRGLVPSAYLKEL